MKILRPRLIKSLTTLAVASGTVVILGAADANWPQFRPHGGVVADNPALPDAWSETENVSWKVEIPGVGWSSPVVWGDHIFVTAAVNQAQPGRPIAKNYNAREVTTPKDAHRWMVYDVDLKSGKIRWSRDLGGAVPAQPKHDKNSYASETPSTDGQRVYVYFAALGLFALDMQGKVAWSKPMDAAEMRQGWGAAASPIVYKDRVLIVNDNEQRSYLAAYNAASGAEVWRVPRDEASNWSTPYIWENAQRTEIVTTGSKRVRSYDLNGKVLWEFSGLSSLHIPTPVESNGLLFIGSGFRGDNNRPTYAVRPGASGDITLKEGETSNQYIAWYYPQLGSYNPSPIAYGDYFYTLYDTSFLTCNDAKTGKQIYGRQRISDNSTGFTASPWAYNGKIFVMSEDGDTFVIQAGPEFKVIGKNSLNEMTLATPAVVGDSVIVRTASKLYRIRKAGR